MSTNPKNEGHESPVRPAGFIQSLSWATLEKLYMLFTKLWTPVQLLLAAAGLAVAVYYGSNLRLSLLNTQRSVALALTAKLEPTRNTHQGIAAFLLSTVREDWARPEGLNGRELDSILREIDAKVRQETEGVKAKEAAQGSAPAAEAPGVAPPSAPEIIRKLNLEVINRFDSTESWQTAIASRRKDSFMVVPATSLRRKTLDEPPLEAAAKNAQEPRPLEADKKDEEARLAAFLQHNPEILFDLNLASELEPLMRRLDKASGERLKVVQTYFITESGVFLIRASGVQHQGLYYGKDFEPYNQYMDRPYFWGAVDAKAGQRKPTPFDYGTKPYLDLGGHGFVVTFSKKFDLPNRRVGVLCVDAKLPEYVTEEVKGYMESLGASVFAFDWIGNENKQPVPLPSPFSWFSSQLNESREARSQVLGNIVVEPPRMSPSQPPSAAEGVVRFTVPVESGEYGDGFKRTKLLAVEFDSAKIQNNLFKNLFLFTTGIILVIAVTWSLFWDYTVLKTEMSNVLKKMAKVMRDASTPFVWLNERNEFVEVNNSFLKVLGYENDNIDGLKRDRATFKSLVSGPTRQTYDDILEVSGAGQETGEYEIDVLTKTGKVLRVRAHGERIPYPTWWMRGLPHRFGIFVEVIDLTPAADREPAEDDPDAPKAAGEGA